MSVVPLPLHVWLLILDKCPIEQIDEVKQIIHIPKYYRWHRLKKQIETKLNTIPQPKRWRVHLGEIYCFDIFGEDFTFIHFEMSTCCTHRSVANIFQLNIDKNEWFRHPDVMRYCRCIVAWA